MSNIVLPQAKIVNSISNTATMLVEENGEISRYNFVKMGKVTTGFIYPLATSVVPDGFLLCDGKAYSRTTYAELFSVIGTRYGAGNGSTTFNVPNLKTRVPVGAGTGYTLGATGGEATHTLTKDEMPSHSHTSYKVANANANGGTGTNILFAGENWAQGTVATNATGGGEAHNNMQPYTVVNYIIATGKNTGVSIQDIISSAQALPLGVAYGGTGANNWIDALKNIGAMHKELLWQNSSSTSTFGAQTLDFDLSPYIGISIYYKNQTSGTVYNTTGLINIGEKFALSYSTPSSTGTSLRKGSVSATGVTFEAPQSSISGVTVAGTMVPVKIYGWRG